MVSRQATGLPRSMLDSPTEFTAGGRQHPGPPSEDLLGCLVGASPPMDSPPMTSRCAHWQAPFDDLLKTVQGSGSHGQLLDIRDALRPRLSADRPLVMLCPHADDGAITAACLLHEYAVRRGLPVVEVLVFAGERNVAAPWLNAKSKVGVREAEFRLECNVLGAEAVCWDLDAYRNSGYQPSPADIDKIVEWFIARKPGALIVPPATDAHLAHRMTRAMAGIGLVGAGLSDCLVMTGWTPWGPLARPNAYFSYEGRGRADQGVGHPLPCLPGPPDRLHRVLLAPGPGLRRAGPRVVRRPQPLRSGPPDRRPIRRRRALPGRDLRPVPLRDQSDRPDPDRPRALAELPHSQPRRRLKVAQGLSLGSSRSSSPPRLSSPA